jgi:hypothetical protein
LRRPVETTPGKRTSSAQRPKSEKRQEETHALQQVGAGQQVKWVWRITLR